MKLIGLTIMICGMIASMMIAHAMWHGYWIHLVGSTLGMYWCYHMKAYSLMALDVFYTIANCIGIYNQILT